MLPLKNEDLSLKLINEVVYSDRTPALTGWFAVMYVI